MNYLLDPLLVAMVFFGATIIPVYRKRVEKIVPRLAFCLWFLYLWMCPNTFSAEVQRIVARWLLLLLGLVEIDVEIFKFILIRWNVISGRNR